jgi:hypothetical protein
MTPRVHPLEPLNQLVISRNCKITTLLKADGSTRNTCTITILGGSEFKLVLPDEIKGTLKPRGGKGIDSAIACMLEQPDWTTHNQKITRVYYRKNMTPRSPPS